jgi:hypothetical protein
MTTTDPAIMAVTTVPTIASRARERGRRGWAGAAGGTGARAAGTGLSTQTPKGGGRSGTPPAGDHNRDMNLPRPGQLPRLPGLSSGG